MSQRAEILHVGLILHFMKIHQFRYENLTLSESGGGVITLYKSPKCPQWGSMSSPDFYRVKITKSKLVGLLHRQNKGYMQKISILAQYLGSKSNLSVFASKLRMTKYVRIAIFQKNFKDIKKFIFLGGTKQFNLKTHGRKLHFLHSYRNEKQLSAACVSETHCQAYQG